MVADGQDGEAERLEKLLEELRERERRFLDVAANELEWFWEVDADGRYTYASPVVEKVLGYTAEEMLDKHFYDLFHPEQRVEMREAALETFARKQPFREFVNRNIHKTGRTVWLSTSGVPILSEHGELLGYRGADTDITARVRSEEQGALMARRIQQSQKMESLGLLAGGIAHDFNNLLVGVLGNVGMALKKIESRSPARYHLLNIEKAAQRAAELTNQLLAYSGRGRFVVEPLDVSHVVADMGHLLETVISKNAVLRYELAGELPAIRADAAQLRQVIMNLITNASDAVGRRSGVVSVVTGIEELAEDDVDKIAVGWELAPGPYVFIEVSDTGAGMNKDTQSQIFDPFYSTKATGRGLGLAAVLGIVRGHAGAIRIYSKPKQGTTFKVMFPAMDRPVEERSTNSADADEWRGEGLILVVDDEPAVRETARMVLEECGFDTLEACDGREALDVFAAKGDRVDAVLLDMTMPHLDGRETFTELRRMRPDVRVILSSGYDERDATDQFGPEGLAGFVQKPYDIDDLIAVIRKVLEAD